MQKAVLICVIVYDFIGEVFLLLNGHACAPVDWLVAWLIDYRISSGRSSNFHLPAAVTRVLELQVRTAVSGLDLLMTFLLKL